MSALILCCAGSVRAQIIVLGSESNAAGESLVEALRIQLTGSKTTLDLRPLGDGGDTTAGAKRLIDGGSARLVVWVHSPGPGIYELHWLGVRQGKIVAAETRVEGASGPSLERTMALKVREVLDELEAVIRLENAMTPPNQPLAAQESTAPNGGPSSLLLLGEFGIRGASGSGNVGPQALIGAGAGLGLFIDRSVLQLWWGLRWGSPFTQHTAIGQVSTTEWVPELTVRALRPIGELWLGGHLQFALRIVRATGLTAMEEKGEQTRPVPAVSAGGDAEFALGARGTPFKLRCALGAEFAPVAQRFAVDRQPLLELGRFRGLAEVSVVISSQ